MKTISTFNSNRFLKITLLTSIWIHASETFRYFILVMPSVKTFQNNAEGVAEMNLFIFTIWGIWDTLLTGFTVFLFWLYASVFGNNLRSILSAATISWGFSFIIFWVGAANIGYTSWNLLLTTLPLSWLELVIATYIASKLYNNKL